MADVFLSYARGDRGTAERLANAIGETGLTVWWDRHIKGGAEFSRDIERQLEAASRVLVLWSKEAVDSRWVRDEASVAADSGRLVSATIDGTPPPLGFRQFQTIDLKGWSARGAAIPAALAEALEVETPAAQAPAAPGPRRRNLLAAGIAALLLAAGTVAVVRPPPFDRLLSGERHRDGLSLAIMPFATDKGSGSGYLGVGLAGALADSLAPLPELKITASTSTQALAGKGLTAPDIGRKLGVSHLVEGDVQHSGGRYAISVRLIEAMTSEQIWARTLQGETSQLQELKSRMARELASALRTRLGIGEGEIAERGNVDPRAYEAYLKARERVSVRDDRDARVEAIKQFRLAASIQPDFADAHAGYAYVMALSLPHQLGMPLHELVAEQQRATARALELDPRNDLAMIARSTALKNFGGKVDQALAIDRAVLKRSPNFGPVHYSLAASLWMNGQAREALDQLELAIERDPFDSLLLFYRAKIHYSLGDYQAVRNAARQCPQQCAGMGWFWLLSIAGFGNEAIVREDFPLLARQAMDGGFSQEDVDFGRAIVDAFVHGRPYRGTPPEQGDYVEFPDAAIDARLFGFEAGLRTAQKALATAHADTVLDILNEGRVTFTPEQRADPRYHRLFRHPKIAAIAAARRKSGVLAGLPLFPVKPYTGR